MSRQIDLIIAREEAANKLKAATKHTPPTTILHTTLNTQHPTTKTKTIKQTNNTPHTAA
jgi:hypothetical protein